MSPVSAVKRARSTPDHCSCTKGNIRDFEILRFVPPKDGHELAHYTLEIVCEECQHHPTWSDRRASEWPAPVLHSICPPGVTIPRTVHGNYCKQNSAGHDENSRTACLPRKLRARADHRPGPEPRWCCRAMYMTCTRISRPTHLRFASRHWLSASSRVTTSPSAASKCG